MCYVFLDFVFESLQVCVGSLAMLGFRAEIVTNLADELFGIIEIDEGARYNVWGLYKATGLLADG